MTDTSVSTQGLMEALQQGLGFTPEDLESNERGRLSEPQKTALVARLNQGGKELGQGCRLAMILLPLIGLILLVVVFFVVAGDIARALLSAVTGFASNPIALVFVIPVVILVLVVGNSMRIQARWRHYLRRLRESPDNAIVRNRQGIVKRRTISGGKGGMATRYIVIRGKWLQVLEQRQYDAFRDGVGYQLYYLEPGPLPYLLSAKVIGGSKN